MDAAFRKRFLTATILMWAAMIACQFIELPGILRSGSVLFQDNFSDRSSGWRETDSQQGFAGYERGAYRIQVTQPKTQIWSNPGLWFINTRIEVDTFKMDGSDDNLLGLICRYRNNKRFYAFYISSDGYSGIAKYKNGQLELLGTQGMPPSDWIKQGFDSNHLRFDCLASTLTGYVNQHKIAEIKDGEYLFGDVGMIAGSLDEAGVDIIFDNFKVLNP